MMNSRRLLLPSSRRLLSSQWSTRIKMPPGSSSTSHMMVLGRDDRCQDDDHLRYQQLRFFASHTHPPPPSMRDRAVESAKKARTQAVKSAENARTRAVESAQSARTRAVESAQSVRSRVSDSTRTYRQGAKKAADNARTVLRDRGDTKTMSGMLKQYGPVFIGTYFSLYVSTLGVAYLGVDSGVIDPIFVMNYLTGGEAGESATTASLVIEYMSHYKLTQPAVPFLEEHPGLSNLAFAWVLVKFTEPVRFVVAMSIVPKLANYLGFIPEEEEAKEDEATPAEQTKEDEATRTK